MRGLLTAVALLSLAIDGRSATGSIVPQEYGAGLEIPMIEIVDDRGETRSLESFKGAPLILAPVFTSCPLACPTIANNLIAAAAESDESLSGYRVVFLSFDPDDDVAALRRFRERQRVPLPWTIARAAPQDVRRLLDALGYSYRKVDGSFVHPNMVIAFTPELKTAKFMMGTSYDLDEALRLARGRKDWVHSYGAITLSTLLLVCISSLVYLVVLIIR